MALCLLPANFYPKISGWFAAALFVLTAVCTTAGAADVPAEKATAVVYAIPFGTAAGRNLLCSVHTDYIQTRTYFIRVSLVTKMPPRT